MFIWVKVTLGQNEFNPSVTQVEIREQANHPKPTQEVISDFRYCSPQSDPQNGIYWFVSERPWWTWNHHNATYEVKVYWNYMVPRFMYPRPANPPPVVTSASLEMLLVSCPQRYLLLRPPPSGRTPLPVRISYRLTDKQRGKAKVFVRIYDPFSPYPHCPVRCFTKTVDRPGSDPIEWDGKDNNGRPLPYGVYSFDILAKVVEYPNGGGHNLRSQFLQIVENPEQGKFTKYVQVCGAQNRQVVACLGYWLQDVRGYPPTEVLLQYFTPAINLTAEREGSKNLGYNEAPIIFGVRPPGRGPRREPTDGFHYILILAKDESSRYFDRSHSSRDALPVGLLGVSHRTWINPGHGQGTEERSVDPGATCRRHQPPHTEATLNYQLAIALRDLLMRDEVFAHRVSDKRFVVHNRPAIRMVSRDNPRFPTDSPVRDNNRYDQRAEWAWRNLQPHFHEPDWAHHIVVIHLNSGPETANGHEIYYALRPDGSNDSESYPFSSRIHHFFDPNGIRACRGLLPCSATRGANNILRNGYGLFWWRERPRRGFRKQPRPAISVSLLEVVFITNAGDEDFILDPANQRLVAQCIHRGMDEHVKDRPRTRPR